MKKQLHNVIVCLFLVSPLVVPVYQVARAGSAPAPAPAASASGPIDITANEQEFIGARVVAKGNVRVKFKDSIVYAPVADLTRDSSGNPQKAVFTGHPHLIQGSNRIDAETLIFEMGSNQVYADGHAHSEVISDGVAPAQTQSTDSVTAAGSSDDKTASEEAAAEADKIASEEDRPGSAADATKTASAVAAKPAQATAPANPEPPEKIITDSDHQEYNSETGQFSASGHVRLVHDNIFVKSDKLTLVYGLDKKPETALFSGTVTATQDRNTTIADNMVYSLSTRRLQATGHVKSVVIQEHHDDKDKGKDKSAPSVSEHPDALGMQSATATEIPAPTDDVIIVNSDSQDYSKQTGRMAAGGTVHLYYNDTVAVGPSCVLLRNPQGKCEKVIFLGRSQVTQPGKRWIADHIELTLATKKIKASGNTRVVMLDTPTTAAPNTQSQVADRPGGTNIISATKVEIAK